MTEYYFAPLEGITGCHFRQVHHRHFPQMDKYFMPFLVPHEKRTFNRKELREMDPENNRGFYAVPQIMTNQAEAFITTAKKLQERGYEEVNLNLGCPSRTVVSKGRGSGFLAFPEELDRFLEKIFDGLDLKISVKTRIGVEREEEFPVLLNLYNRYPIKELILHPRLQADQYRLPVRREVWKWAVSESKNPLCYNGDLQTAAQLKQFRQEFPTVKKIMIGRGLLRNPGLIQQVRTGRVLDKQQLRAYHNDLYQTFQDTQCGARNVLFRMKEHWGFLIDLFEDAKKYGKKIKKAQRLCDYERAVDQLFAERELVLSKEGEADA